MVKNCYVFLYVFCVLRDIVFVWACCYVLYVLQVVNELVCDLFSEYSRLSVTLEHTDGNDSLVANLTLLVMIAKKALMDVCEYHAVSCLEVHTKVCL